MIVNNIEDLKAIIPTVIGENFGLYAQVLSDSEYWLRHSILGDIKPDDSDYLLEKCRTTIAYRAYWTVIPQLDLVNTGNGFAIVNTQNLAPASRDRVNSLRESIKALWVASEGDLYEFLEDNHSEQWTQSPYSTVISNSLLPTLRLFNRSGIFAGGYTEWRQSRMKHRLILANSISPVLSSELTNRLIKDGDKMILDDVRTAFAAYFNGDTASGDSLIAYVRGYVRSHLDDYPEYRDSTQNQTYKRPENPDGIFIGL